MTGRGSTRLNRAALSLAEEPGVGQGGGYSFEGVLCRAWLVDQDSPAVGPAQAANGDRIVVDHWGEGRARLVVGAGRKSLQSLKDSEGAAWIGLCGRFGICKGEGILWVTVVTV